MRPATYAFAFTVLCLAAPTQAAEPVTATCEAATAYADTSYRADGTVVQHYGGSHYADGTLRETHGRSTYQSRGVITQTDDRGAERPRPIQRGDGEIRSDAERRACERIGILGY